MQKIHEMYIHKHKNPNEFGSYYNEIMSHTINTHYKVVQHKLAKCN